MDVRQFRHFAAVAETLHFGRAAERLRMTQPPLSQSILALEKELGAPLFVRTKRNVRLTPLGEQWLPQVQAALAALDALPGAARRMRDGRSGFLALSFVSTADYSVLPSLVRRYSQAYPEVEIRLFEATSDVQLPALVEGERHAGIVIPPTDQPLPPALAYRRLLREPLVAAVPSAWIDEGRIGSDAVLSAEELLASPLILFPKHVAPAFHDLVTGHYRALGGDARIAQEAIQMQTIISLVSSGLGIALVPASLRNLARTGVTYVPLAGTAPELETGLAWRKGEISPTLANFLKLTEPG
ncbi:LysR family transcriptional regulator [Caulobacter flavus]|uniref:LysR family transcriptional regulator n=1 Tax=Caulobacter flavus TaxID=1679497 RepID=A0A2N5CQG3_9CAUL|nr:LysR substrate-binding domain-containing protein [Caulobacter flavus]AYV48698.1 LysR family transcriptional regulator [Caulobacter flavus]PLR10229.1 LysR family transcriptional regulator [Caulobacter flavus]